MAAMDPESLKLGRSLVPAQIPEKLRCVTCDKLAMGAMRLCCCDNTICHDCHTSMTATECPICDHSPFSADSCITAKSLQLTVKAFLKTELKKAKELESQAASQVQEPEKNENTAVVPTPTIEESTAAGAGGEKSVVPELAVQKSVAHDGERATPSLEATAAEQAVTINGKGIANGGGNDEGADEVNGDGTQRVGDEQDEDDDEDEYEDDGVTINVDMPSPEEMQKRQSEQAAQAGISNQQGFNASDANTQMDQQQQGMDFNNNQFGNFGPSMMGMGGMTGMPGMNAMNGMNGMNGFNPMMNMGAWGMGMPNMNMMGMAGMGMDPSMMFGGNFGGDMGGMGGPMGMNGMGGNGMNGMGGFSHDQGGYSQSSYGPAHRQNFSNDRGYGRPYGRFNRGGRGNQFRGRGGWGNQPQHQYNNGGFNNQFGGYNNQQPQNIPTGPGQNPGGFQRERTGSNAVDPAAAAGRASPTYDPVNRPSAANGEDAETSANEKSAAADTNSHENTNSAGEDAEQGQESGDGELTSAKDAVLDDDKNGNGDPPRPNDGLAQIQSVVHTEPGDALQQYDEGSQGFGHNQTNFNNRGHAGTRGGRGGHGGFSRGDATELTPAPAPAPPINAPKGPKAFLQGLPNTGWSGISLAQQQKPTNSTPTPRPESHARSVRNEDSHRDSNGLAHERDRPSSRTGSRRRSRSPGSDHESSRRSRKDGERRQHRAEGNDADGKKYRSRSESRTDDGHRRHRDDDDKHRSSRSHRDRSKDRRRRREKEEDHESSRRKSSKSHHEREADYDDHKDSRRSSRKHSRRDDDDDRESDRKDKDRSSNHRSSRHERSSRDDGRHSTREERPTRTIIEPPSDEIGFKIKGSGNSSRAKASEASKISKPTESAALDPYAQERALAQQGREAREAQRRQSTHTSTSALGKRGRDAAADEVEVPRGPKSDRRSAGKIRRVNYVFEDEVQVGRDEGRRRG
ncbi:unnamed protein product [Zymoseptoria tritici ST99CH_1E4]|uniref:RING-type domain-containing protein n=1 Tax=Zymoseptoria tritici ST99CH_1E4 TaxID=1276532 RepID=A0A2H1G632_ZYMTR|nr:unnamed protein product [Zymoseptoria tritici ST99CH_1E4]